MKLIIQIPCYNEAQSLPVVLGELPRSLPGIDEIEWLVVDDGSTDETVAVARACGVDHIVHHPRNMGLARAFMTGISACLDRGADIIVNTDADNQYRAADLPRLVAPIVKGRADITIGARPISSIPHFSRGKKVLQRLGSWVVQWVSGLRIPDAPSGFRAYSREAAKRMNVFSTYTYTLETIIQAGKLGIAVESVPIRVNDDLRPSRLVKSLPNYVRRSIVTIFRIFVIYRPFRTFATAGVLLLAIGFAIGLRFLVFFAAGHGTGHVQSLILAAVLLLMGFQLCVVGVLADVSSVNRRLLEDIQARVRDLPVRNPIPLSARFTEVPGTENQ